MLASAVTDWLTALGTIGAVVVAVGLQLALLWREHRRRPKLTVAFDEHQRQDEVNLLTDEACPYLRLGVSNGIGKDTARNVQVLVLEVEPLATTIGIAGARRWLVNPALGWANSLDPLPRMNIPPGATRYVDLGRWMRKDFDRLLFVLSVVPEPAAGRHMLEAGRWGLRIAVVLDNGEASTWMVEVWFEENTLHKDAASLALRNLRVSVQRV